MDLSIIPALAPYEPALRALGYDSVEHFVGAATLAGPQLTAYLGTDVNLLLAQLPVAAMAVASVAAAAPASFKLGVTLDRIPIPSLAPARIAAAAAGPLPSAIDHISRQPAIRDQGDRFTCVAFASVATLEDYLSTRSTPATLSEEYVFWDCKQHDGVPAVDGTWLGIAMPLLKSDGDCDATVWPYNPTPTPGNLGHDPPPPGAAANAATHRAATPTQLAATMVRDLKTAIANDRCVACSVQVFNSSFFTPPVVASGDITMPVPAEPLAGGHAICLVGYRDDDRGGGHFLVRNSWGTRWGTSNSHGKGYGTIPYAYINSFAMEAWYFA